MNKFKLFFSTAIICASTAVSVMPVSAFDISYDNVTHKYEGEVYKLVVNEKSMNNLPLEPIIFNDRALVPVREIFEEMGATVDYAGETQTVYISYGGTSITMRINDNVAVINGERKTIPDNVVPKLITKVGGETKTMVPLRFISETMGMDVVFDGNHGTIFVNSPNAYESMNTPVTMEPSTQNPSGSQNQSKPQATQKPNLSKPSGGVLGSDEGVTGVDLNTEFIMQGVDVSHWQNDIDWEKAKDEIDFAILSIGYGQDLTEQDDKKFKQNADACTKYGIPFGVYIYSYAMNVDNSSSEADHVLRLIKDYDLSFPVYYDMEEEKQGKLPAEQLGQMAKTFCDKIQAAGYDVGIYANTYWWTNILTDSAFSNPTWYKWVAQYNTECTYTGKYTMWQYTSQGSVAGMNGDIDMNYWYGQKRVVTSK